MPEIARLAVNRFGDFVGIQQDTFSSVQLVLPLDEVLTPVLHIEGCTDECAFHNTQFFSAEP